VIAALRYEWVRVSTVRSTRISLVLAFLVVGLLAWAGSAPTYNEFGPDGPVGPPTVAWWDAFAQPLLLAAIFAAVVASQNIGQEYRFGLIRLTLTAFPQRSHVLTAKLVSVVATGLVFTAVSYAGSYAALLVRGYATPPPESPPADATFLLRGAVFMVLWALSAWALAGLTRQTAIGIAVPVVSGFIVEQILGGVLADKAPWLQDILPWSTSTRWFVTSSAFGGDDPTVHVPPVGWAALGVFGVWVLVLVVLEIVAFVRRDA
jgi:ABC-2 type transport system permease protein